MKASPRWNVDVSQEPSNEGRRSSVPSRPVGQFEDSAFHTVDLGFVGHSEEAALDRMSATVVEQFAAKIARLVAAGDLDLARTLMRRLQRLDPTYTLPAEWEAILDQD